MTSVFIISAPSGSGKSTLVSYLMRGVAGLRFSVSYTTRAPRGDEKDGKELSLELVTNEAIVSYCTGLPTFAASASRSAGGQVGG